MKLNDLRRRIARAIDPDTNSEAWETNPMAYRLPRSEGIAMGLEPMEDAPIAPIPGQAQPLTDDQRANLEKLRNRYAPDRQNRRAGVDNPMQRAAENTGVSLELIRRVTGQNATSSLDRMRDEQAGD